MNNEQLLNDWDDGKTCQLIEMGGMGSDYEMAIQLTAMEGLRWLMSKNPEMDTNDKENAISDAFDRAVLEAIKPLGLNDKYGLSGAQFDAAKGVAWMMFKNGYENALAMFDDPERVITITKKPFA